MEIFKEKFMATRQASQNTSSRDIKDNKVTESDEHYLYKNTKSPFLLFLP